MQYADCHAFMAHVAQRNPGQPEYIQAVTEVMESLWPFIAEHPRNAEQGLLERLVEAERTAAFLTTNLVGSTAWRSAPTRAACASTLR